MAKKERGLATGMWMLATLAKVAVPLAIMEANLGLFKEFSGWKLTGYGLIAAVLTALYFGKHVVKMLSNMRMNSFKGLIITLIEVAPFFLLYAFVMTMKQNIELYESMTFWIAFSIAIGSMIMRLHDYYLQEAIEIERQKRYGS